MTVLLADRLPIVREGLRAVLQQEADLRIVAECGDGLEATRMASVLQPAVAVIDRDLPRLDGLGVLRELRMWAPRTRPVIYSRSADEREAYNTVQNGAAAYALKERPPQDLVRAIREAAAGRIYLSPPLDQLGTEGSPPAQHERHAERHESLTSREREIFQMVVLGYTGTQIARRLSISPRTVEHHQESLRRKLGCCHKADLVRYAVEKGLAPAVPGA